MHIWRVTFWEIKAKNHPYFPKTIERFAAIDFKSLYEMIGDDRLNTVFCVQRCGSINIKLKKES